MTSEKQKKAAIKNIKKAQKTWISMSKTRAKPGSTGEGEYYRIVVRDKNKFITFRNQDVGDPGHIQRLAGKRKSGSWATQAWLVSKDDAHMENGELIADTREVEELLDSLGSRPVHERGDIFKSQDRRNIAEKDKPTRVQRQAGSTNIRKAQTIRSR